jgi:ADP-ribose pyrophosphatase YjhB (NUDIX family)
MSVPTRYRGAAFQSGSLASSTVSDATDSSFPSRATDGADAADGDDGAARRVRDAAVKIAALAQNGLTYGVGRYDLDRYRQLADLAADLLSAVSGRSSSELALELGRDSGYATPKVDVRGAVFDSSEQVLLLRERSDGFWSLPGGWADPLDSPATAVSRETREETGYGARAVKLAACWDRERQGHAPALPVHAYKLFFICELDGEVGEPDDLETTDVGWFPVDALPPLSKNRVNEAQIVRMLEHHRDRTLPADFE